jgi:hypothetical protein
MDSITIAYALHVDGIAPNNCQASTTYKTEAIVAYGGSWEEAKTNAILRCQQLKAIGDPPASDTIDLDVPPV